jgi:hypothetical protein
MFCVEAYMSNAHAHMLLRNVRLELFYKTRKGYWQRTLTFAQFWISHSVLRPIQQIIFWVRSVLVSEGVALIFDSSCAFISAWTSLFSHSISLPIIGWKQKCRTNHCLLSVFQRQLNERSWISIMKWEFILCKLVALCFYLINRTVAVQGINMFK